jgi:uncharacterized protein
VLRQVTEAHLDDIAIGAAILGTGGGGNPYVGKLLAREAIREHGPVEVVPVDELPDDAFVITSAMMGAPTVMVEKLPAGHELERAFRAVESYMGRKATHVISVEMGGLNSVTPLCLAARIGLPVVDADGMGRAFPELQMVIPTLYGIASSPMGMADEKGNVSVFETISNSWTERLARSAVVDMGCTAMIACYALTGEQARTATVPGTLSLTEELGRLVRETQARNGDTIGAVADRLGGRRIFSGKIADVDRKTDAGFARVESRVDGLDGDAGVSLTLHTQNEHLAATSSEGAVLATTPDLIIVLDLETGDPITTEELRYGCRVAVVAAPCDPRWRTPEGLELVGPSYFGYDFDYVPVEATAART